MTLAAVSLAAGIARFYTIVRMSLTMAGALGGTDKSIKTVDRETEMVDNRKTVM